MDLFKKKLGVKLNQCFRNIELELAFVPKKVISTLRYCAVGVALLPLLVFGVISMSQIDIMSRIEAMNQRRAERRLERQEEREAMRVAKAAESLKNIGDDGSKKLQDDLSMEMKGEIKSLKDFHIEFFRDVYTPNANRELVMNSRRLLVLDKSLNTVFLSYLCPANQWKIYKFYVAGHGRNNGRKVAMGDSRTPQGLYFVIDKRKNPLQIFNVYGPRAFVLNYPNRKDRAENRTGYGIWIHGLEPDSAARPTRGCVVLENHDLLDLGQYIEVGTPVYIVEKIDRDFREIIDIEKIDNEWNYAVSDKEYLRMLVEFVDNWAKAWASRDIDRYMEFYAPTFMDHRGMDYEAWKNFKARIFAANEWIEVSVSDVTPVEIHENKIIIEFLQHYRASNNMNSWGMKRLVLVRYNGNWLIENELMERSIS